MSCYFKIVPLCMLISFCIDRKDSDLKAFLIEGSGDNKVLFSDALSYCKNFYSQGTTKKRCLIPVTTLASTTENQGHLQSFVQNALNKLGEKENDKIKNVSLLHEARTCMEDADSHTSYSPLLIKKPNDRETLWEILLKEIRKEKGADWSPTSAEQVRNELKTLTFAQLVSLEVIDTTGDCKKDGISQTPEVFSQWENELHKGYSYTKITLKAHEALAAAAVKFWEEYPEIYDRDKSSSGFAHYFVSAIKEIRDSYTNAIGKTMLEEAMQLLANNEYSYVIVMLATENLLLPWSYEPLIENNRYQLANRWKIPYRTCSQLALEGYSRYPQASVCGQEASQNVDSIPVYRGGDLEKSDFVETVSSQSDLTTNGSQSDSGVSSSSSGCPALSDGEKPQVTRGYHDDDGCSHKDYCAQFASSGRLLCEYHKDNNGKSNRLCVKKSNSSCVPCEVSQEGGACTAL